MKFYVVRGNPPYQEKVIGNSTQKPTLHYKI